MDEVDFLRAKTQLGQLIYEDTVLYAPNKANTCSSVFDPPISYFWIRHPILTATPSYSLPIK